MNKWRILGAGLILTLWSCEEAHMLQKLDPEKSGVVFENTLTESDDFNIIDYLYFFNGGGVAAGDINNDGLVDLYFSGNQVSNRLYLNKGNLQFEDITDKARVGGSSTWNTGSIMADFNGDGLLDIYVCAVVGIKGMNGYNELFINNGDLTFTESAADFGLDYDSFSSNAALLDYDLDGDLDVYLLNHAVHTQESFGNADLRNRRTYETGDKLLRNDGHKFTDVSEAAGIYGGVNGYGLGIGIADFNTDGYPDIYVGNDFHEDDYLYINNRDGTFSEVIKSALTQISRFSMGNDIADLNHDGLPDILSLDMLPDDEEVLKRSDGDERFDILKLRTTKYGYYYQFSRNMLQMNNGDGTFTEKALMSGIAATDWSWSALFADLDMDGNEDVFISNGIPRRPNDLDYIKFVSSDQIKNTISETKLVDKEALGMMPSGALANAVFKGKGDGSFEELTGTWIDKDVSYSTATALADLDNDGDLDVIVNNIDAQASIYINQTNGSANHLKIKLNYSEKNPYGIGSKIHAYNGSQLQYKELYTVRGFQASSEPVVHFGLGQTTKLDSVRIIWPDGTTQVLLDVQANQTLTIQPKNNTKLVEGHEKTTRVMIFEKIDPTSIGLAYRHKEDDYSDFKRLKLIPYQQSDRGPATAVGDFNEDGKDDVYFGGSKWIAGSLYQQTDNGFNKEYVESSRRDSITEETNALMLDIDNNGRMDLLIGTGGADFYNKSEPLLDRVYMASDSEDSYLKVTLPDIYENTGCLKACDYNQDGYMDVFIGNRSTSNDFGKLPASQLLKNDNGKLIAVQSELFGQLGMVTDAIWLDYDQDGDVDLIVVGEWMRPTFLRNEGGTFKVDPLTSERLNGLWQTVSAFDVDNDGDLDITLGNWGLNSKYKASADLPMRMYYGDLDANGATETILAVAKEGKYYPLAGLDMLAEQMPGLRKRFNSYKEFAGQPIEKVLDQEMMKKASMLTVSELASGYLRNDQGTYTFVPFASDLQLSPIMSQLVADFDRDGDQELVLGGNYFGVQPYHGRFGSFGGAMIESDGSIVLGRDLGLQWFNRSVRSLNIITVGEVNYLMSTIHDDSVQVYRLR